MVDTEAIRRSLLVLAVVGAANSDATREQRIRLRDEVMPALRNPEVGANQAYADAVRITGSIMGPQWKPVGEWGDWILSLLGEGR